MTEGGRDDPGEAPLELAIEPRSRPQPAPLELAVEPRSRPGVSPPPVDAPRSYEAAGGTAVSEPAVSPAAVGLIVKLALLAALLAGGYLVYLVATRSSVSAVTSPYTGYTGITIELPGSGWKVDRSNRVNRTMGTQWMRMEALFRGRSMNDPDDLIMPFRVHGEGMFPAEVDLEVLRRQATAIAETMRQQSSLNIGQIACQIDREWRSEPAARCAGDAVINDLRYTLGIEVWQPSTDDVVGLFYASVALDTAEFEAVVRAAR